MKNFESVRKSNANTCPSTGPESGVKMDLTVLVGEGLARMEAAGNFVAGLLEYFYSNSRGRVYLLMPMNHGP